MSTCAAFTYCILVALAIVHGAVYHEKRLRQFHSSGFGKRQNFWKQKFDSNEILFETNYPLNITTIRRCISATNDFVHKKHRKDITKANLKLLTELEASILDSNKRHWMNSDARRLNDIDKEQRNVYRNFFEKNLTSMSQSENLECVAFWSHKDDFKVWIDLGDSIFSFAEEQAQKTAGCFEKSIIGYFWYGFDQLYGSKWHDYR